jgi:short-subunit dehydrogenase
MSSAKKKWAVVTGASAGLGVEFARQLARKGYDLVLTARRRDRLEKIAEEVERDMKVSAVVLESDLSVAGASAALLRELDERGIEVELLVNNAGVGLHGEALAMPIDRLSAMIQLNVTALVELSIALGAKMAARGSGAILNVSSTASFQPNPYFAVYGATKAFVTSFSLALAREVGPRGVRVLAHCPGPTRTEFNDVADMSASAGDWLYMSAERCVAIGLSALERGRWLKVTGFLNALAAFFSRRSPMWLATIVAGRMMRPTRPPRSLPAGPAAR